MSSNDVSDFPSLVVVRRRKMEDATAKSGAWKVAYSDFMTAMMAFFLVMWLISITDPKSKESLASYFNPIQLSSEAPDVSGLDSPEGINRPAQHNRGEATEASRLQQSTRQTTRPGHASQLTEGKVTEANRAPIALAAVLTDPYGVLDTIAAEAEARQKDPSTQPGSQPRDGTAQDGKAARDKLDPLSWQFLPQLTTQPDSTDPNPVTPEDVRRRPERRGEPTTPNEMARAFMALTEKDEPRRRADEQRPEARPEPRPELKPEKREAEKSAEIADAKLMEALVGRGDREAATRAPALINIEAKRTSEGLLISLTDQAHFGMFASGSAEPRPETLRELERIAKLLADKPGTISIRGHTDGNPFRSKGNDNWRLSAARAQMAFYMLVRSGLDEKRIDRIEGHADRQLRNAKDVGAAENRRIEILVKEPKG